MKKGFYPLEEERFRFRNAFWKPVFRVSENDINVKEIYEITGPMCLECGAVLEFREENYKLGICPICKRRHELERNVIELRRLAHIAYQAKLDNKLKTISLDSPIQPIKDRSEDEQHWVEAKLGYTNDGRKIAVVYIGDKSRNVKSQNFIDLDNEQLRSDKADEKPHEIVATLTAEFLKSRHKIEKK